MEMASPPRVDYLGDPLPAGAIARLGTVRFRHGGPIYCFLFSPDGKTIASCSGAAVHLWDVATGLEVWRVDNDSTEKQDVWTLAFSRDGKLLACGGRRGELSLKQANARGMNASRPRAVPVRAGPSSPARVAIWVQVGVVHGIVPLCGWRSGSRGDRSIQTPTS